MKLRHGTAFIYDDNDDIAGLRDPDGSELYLVMNTGTFISLTDQTALPDTAAAMTYEVDYITHGITRSGASRIYVDRQATYNVQFSAMFSNPEATAYAVSLWLKVNGANAIGSCTDITVPAKHGSANGKSVPSWNFFLELNAGDYFELYWSTPQATVFIENQDARTAPDRPAIPSVILTVNEINGQRRTS